MSIVAVAIFFRGQLWRESGQHVVTLRWRDVAGGRS